MKKTPTLLVFVGMMLLASWQVASAEFYRYVDTHGNVLYTDDLSKIPTAQREAIESYQESHGAPATVQKSPEKDSATAQPQVDAQGFEKERLALEQEKKILDREYEQLKQQSTALEEAKKRAVTPEQIQAHDQEITNFNTHAEAYQKKSDAFNAKVNSYNDKVNAKPTEPEKK